MVLVEGQTEETFVNDVLSEHLCGLGFYPVVAKLIGNSRHPQGGIRNWASASKDIVRHLKQDPGVSVTTMVDYYGLPHGADRTRAWPGRTRAAELPFAQKVPHVEEQLAQAIQGEMGDKWDSRQFVPFMIMHEFEGLLFSDCARFASGIGREPLTPDFQAIRNAFSSPEEINDSPVTHPSRRIRQLVPDYEKPLHGNLAALEIGLDATRSECPHFRRWLERLAALVS